MLWAMLASMPSRRHTMALALCNFRPSNPFSERFPNRLFINALQHSFSIGRARLREVAAVVSKTGPNCALIPVDLGPLAPSRRLHDDDGTRLDSTHPLRTPKSSKHFTGSYHISVRFVQPHSAKSVTTLK